MAWARREIFRAAFFLWITPFDAVFWRTETVFLKFSSAFSRLLSLKAALTSLTAVFALVLSVRFRSLAAWHCRALLIADLWFAKVFSPEMSDLNVNLIF
jgi:hypothetical protein